MRLEEPFVYSLTDIGAITPIFDFLAKAGPIDVREMYATFNMGAGFAVYVDAKNAARCVEVATAHGYRGWVGGAVRKDGSRKAVEIDHAEVICLGCGGMAGLDERIKSQCGVPVIDGVSAAVTLAESLVTMGLSTSKIRTYGAPRPKRIIGWPISTAAALQ
jgi:hypothetical protein